MFSWRTAPAGRDLDGVLAEVGKLQVLAQQPAVGVGVGAHAPRALGGELAQLGDQAAAVVEELVRLIALEPALQQLQAVRVLAHVRERHLVGAPGAFGLVALDLLGSRPALGRPQHDHRPARALGLAGSACLLLDGRGSRRVAWSRVAAIFWCISGGSSPFHEVRRVAVAAEQRLQLLVADAGEDGRVGDLVAVQVQDRQHGPVAHRVQELVGMPGGGEGSGLGLAVSDHAGDDQVGVVEGHAVGVGQAVAELTALVDGAGRLGGHVAADVAGEGELLEELLQALGVLALVRIDLGIGPLEIGGTEDARGAVARARRRRSRRGRRA